MLRFNPNWFHRILRNAEPEVHVTVIETPPVPETPVSQVATAVDDAARIAALAESMGKADPELLARLDAIQSAQQFIIERLGTVESGISALDSKVSVAAVAEVVEEIEEEIVEEAIAELPREEIPPAAPVPPTEEPKKRNRRWI